MPFISRKTFRKRSISPGDLRHKITIQKRAISPPSGSGVDYSSTFTDLATVSAAIESITPKQQFGDININENVTHKFYIRFMSGIDLNCWVLHENKRYPIVDIKNWNHLNQWLELQCNEKGSADKEASQW